MRGLATATVPAITLATPGSARAAFPGANGSIARALIARARAPASSPDGRWIACAAVAERGRSGGLRVARADGSDRRVLTHDGDDGALAWAPDGVARMRAEGRRVKRLAGRGMEPACSPDGRRIVFSRGDALRTIGAVGGTPRRLTERATNDELYAPEWQPRPGA